MPGVNQGSGHQMDGDIERLLLSNDAVKFTGQTMKKAKGLIKDITPPVLYRWARSFSRDHDRPAREIEPCERDSEYYDRTFISHQHWLNHYTESPYYPLWTVIADRIVRRGLGSVLDIGCGPGQFASLLRDKGLSHYAGIDFSPRRIAQARNVCPEFAFTEADVFETDLSGAANNCDAVVCCEFLEHVERDREVLEKISAGTWFFGTVPNFPDPAHVRHFSNAREVSDRYEHLFADFSVVTHLADLKGTEYFIMEGCRH